MVRKLNIRNKITKKVVIIFAAVLVVFGGGVAFAYQKITQDDTPPAVTTPSDTPTISDGPPTEDEKQALIDRNEQRINPAPTEGKRTVNPVITMANQAGNEVTVNAYVAGVVEEGGSCTLTLTRNNLTVTKTVTAVGNATTTNCPPFFIGRSEFSEPGEWSAVVTYNSEKASGSSQSKMFTVK